MNTKNQTSKNTKSKTWKECSITIEYCKNRKKSLFKRKMFLKKGKNTLKIKIKGLIKKNIRTIQKRKKKEEYVQSSGKKNVLLSPLLSSPHREHQPICLLRKSSNISRKVSEPAEGSVTSAQTQIWPYSSLYLPPKSTVSG